LNIDLASRTAVLASGSNAAPARLADKCGDDAVIPVARVEVADTAVVYSAHVSRYGSIPATRIAHQGSRTFVHVPLFDGEQLAAVDATEGSYQRERLTGGFPPFLGDVWTYASWRGLLGPAGQPIRLAEVEAASELLAAGQIDALGIVAAITGVAGSGQQLSELITSGQVEPEDVNRLLQS
jgi:hypothetical protein